MNEKSSLRPVLSVYTYTNVMWNDCFLLVKNSTNASSILELFNSANSCIKFEVEEQDSENCLSLLDVNIQISDEGNILTKFYEKKAKRGLFVNAFSHIPRQTKQSSIRAEHHRIQSLCSTSQSKEAAMKNFQHKLQANGYSESQIKKNLSTRSSRHRQLDKSYIINFSIPFV